MTKTEIDQALTPAQAAELLNCCEMTVIRMLKDGRLKGFKAGTHWRIAKEVLDKYRGVEND